MNNITPSESNTSDGFKPLGRDAAPETSELLRPSKSWLQATIWTLLGTAGFAIAWLAIAKTDEVVVATGKLEPLGSVKDIQMPVGGVVQDILVKEGQQVKANQILLRLDTEADLDLRVRRSGEISGRAAGVPARGCAAAPAPSRRRRGTLRQHRRSPGRRPWPRRPR